MQNCIFCKIINKELPSKIEFEDDDIIIFHDINPKADVHLLIVPKMHIVSMLNVTDSHEHILGKIMLYATKIAHKIGLHRGYKLLINTGKDHGQEVMHLHLHVVGNY